tara:strand:+ start:118 stop:315 length:198 start_codon:yes stop_codon:yes gene_type:complete
VNQAFRLVSSWLERRIVVPEVAGSKPVFHPEDEKPLEFSSGFFISYAELLDLIIVLYWNLIFINP